MTNCYRIILTAILVLVVSNLCFGQFGPPIQVTTTGGYHPSVSPDGEWVVFGNIYEMLSIIRTDGTDNTLLSSAVPCYQPDWSRHNDSLIVFIRTDSAGSGEFIEHYQSLATMNVFTMNATHFYGGEFDDDPAWAPDGSFIAIQNSDPDGVRLISYPDTIITDVSCSDNGGICEGEHPTWSPDGNWIAFEDGLEILKVQTTGGDAEAIVEGIGDASYPTWSPDGESIAFTLGAGDYNHVWVIEDINDSQNLIQVTDGLVIDARPTWSPESDTIYFTRRDFDNPQNDIWKTGKVVPTSIDDETVLDVPSSFTIGQNYPNPFNPVTTIEYSVPTRSQVTIEVFNTLGQKVITLIDKVQSAGNHTLKWDSKSTSGQKVSSGVYLYRFQVGNHVEMKRMVLLK